ncbi:hypothetical protein BN6_38560 [Saccharothrix espanaensis DSM 44229]|uniref:Beta-lactamase-related domain-containing protein n=1 Tax=Saccharothrix espanaensis (strain ATCC 51144 / DSM 44229 / JCM 9112 / NBRC 15066 / NRRL 15764) TaxID=1179773 RepID=K0JTN7_SACES|nr:hypothetical protein BN6_38560 [Saccharothrix espanaensis DSM 44229]
MLSLVGEGRVVLDAPVTRYLPGALPDWDRSTVRNLLQHTSGLYNYTLDVYVSSADFVRKRFKHWEPADCWRWPPGTRCGSSREPVMSTRTPTTSWSEW